MSIHATTRILCDGANCLESYGSSDPMASAVRRVAADSGWRLRRLAGVGLVDLCPACNQRAMDAALASPVGPSREGGPA